MFAPYTPVYRMYIIYMYVCTSIYILCTYCLCPLFVQRRDVYTLNLYYIRRYVPIYVMYVFPSDTSSVSYCCARQTRLTHIRANCINLDGANRTKRPCLYLNRVSLFLYYYYYYILLSHLTSRLWFLSLSLSLLIRPRAFPFLDPITPSPLLVFVYII